MADSLDIEYRFAWRWLLPASSSEVSLIGFDSAARHFWQTWADRRGGKARLVVIDADESSLGPAAPAELSGADIVAAVGSSRNVSRCRRFLVSARFEVREYALLPPSRPRLVIPLANRRHTLESLRLHRPGRRSRRLGVALMGLLARVRCLAPFRKRLLIATKGASTRSTPGDISQIPASSRWEDFGLYLGNSEPGRKTVALAFGGADPKSILKSSDSTEGRAAIRNEASVLETLAKSEIGPRVPRLESFHELREIAVLVQQFRKRKGTDSRRMNREVIGLLKQMVRRDQRTIPLSEWLAATGRLLLAEAGDGESDLLRDYLDRRGARNAQLLLHFCHGDLAPWNCAWTEEGLFVFDWESGGAGTGLSDAFFYTLARSLTVGERSSRGVLVKRALQMGQEVVDAAVLPDVDVVLQFVVFAVERMRKYPLLKTLAALVAEPSTPAAQGRGGEIG